MLDVTWLDIVARQPLWFQLVIFMMTMLIALGCVDIVKDIILLKRNKY